MKLKLQKKLAGKIFGSSQKRVKFDTERLSDIKEAITRYDLRALIADGAISKQKKKGISHARANKRQTQKNKGRQKGQGKRKGKKTARLSSKQAWMNRIRLIRSFLKALKTKDSITKEVFRNLYLKSKGGFFRSKKHLKIYLTENKLVTNNHGKK